MNESIQRSSGEVAIVIYDAPLPPKYFRLTKKFIRILFVVVPLLSISLAICLIIWGLGSRIKEAPTPSLPSVMNKNDSKIYTLEAEVESLKQSNKDLALKLSAGPGTTSVEDPFLLVIKKPYGMQNFLAQNKVTLDQFKFVPDGNKTSLKFQIISSSPETKVSGHVLVFMISDAGLVAYPSGANLGLTEGVKYSTGEPFAVSRLRPTNAEFLARPAGEAVKFVIYIFSREGDLLLIKETESYKLGNK